MTIANLESAGPAAQLATRQARNAVVASVLGWSLDLFDLFILLYVAPVVGALFFPSTVPTLSLAAVYASFAVTLLMRPVGSVAVPSSEIRVSWRRTVTLPSLLRVTAFLITSGNLRVTARIVAIMPQSLSPPCGTWSGVGSPSKPGICLP